VKRFVVPLAALGLMLAVLPSARAASAPSVTVIYHPGPAEGDAYLLAQAYPGLSLEHQQTMLGEIRPNIRWSGDYQSPSAADQNIKAVPGIFSLAADPATFRLNISAFVTCPPGETEPFIQSYRLTKMIPGSNKCPMQFPNQTFYQFGRGIRTWWALNYTMPGTKFVLEVTVRCLQAVTKQPRIHIDRWTWMVAADLDTLENVIHLQHQNAISTLEVPCIVGEDLYRMLLDQVDGIRQALLVPGPQGMIQAQNALFNTEGLILANTCFVDLCLADMMFPNGPPSNLTADQLTMFGICGIMDTIENPCACKLLVDLEYIGIHRGIVSL
jgi:hypothetical protein